MLTKFLRAAAGYTPPTDPDFNQTVLLLHGDGTNGGQNNTFIDSSTNNFTVTRNGNATQGTVNPFVSSPPYSTSVNGGSMYFDGTGDYLSVADSTAFDLPGDFTVEFWIYPIAATSNTYMAVALGDELSGRNGFNIFASAINNNMGFYANDVNVIRISPNIILPGQWYHVATVRNGTTISFYVNGTVRGSAINTVSYTGTAGNGFAVAAAYANAYFPRTNAYYANIRLVKGTAVYTANFTPPTAPLTPITNTQLLLNGTNAAIFDNTQKNNLETVGNAQINTTVKKYGTGSIEFDGTGDWLTMLDNIDLQLQSVNFTIEFWVYLASGDTGSNRGLIAKGGASTGWLVSLNTTQKVVFTFTSSTITSSGAITLDAWNHIAVVRQGTGTNLTKIYINGTNDGTGTVSTNFNQTEIMYIGANRIGATPMKGYMDDIRITKGVARYTTNFTPPTAAFPNS